MEAGNLNISRAQGNACWGIKIVGLCSFVHCTYGEMQELDSANHGGEKQWPSMTPEEEDLISRLHHLLGERWELIAKRLPDRTAEEVERYWGTKERRELGEDKIHKPVCARLSPSFKFTMDEPVEGGKPSQTGS
ncbi:myb-related protein Zm38-like isoform X2 [Phoenix dactylifera]|uniref:Myb-related protein Zm38-like isoform X2 n=1 Tax=Phoenix dactylifera TaxID=42345 RepID=A0A8B8JB74_PHODC|nr:myb-related protein Zm38-like isoform X2 [Phoenix dactylifera]